MTPEDFNRRRNRNNLVIGAVLLGLVVLFFLITVVRIGQAAAS